jgi:NAD(P)-dependent dehydrogenase (short-subunit alcohol dehydrogenase family)
MDRLKGKVAVVIGAGQTPGEEMGNGRATTIRFAQEGALILAVDLSEESAPARPMAACPIVGCLPT